MDPRGKARVATADRAANAHWEMHQQHQRTMQLKEQVTRLYAGELGRALEPPKDPRINRKQMVALIRYAEEHGTEVLETPDAWTWIWSDLHLGHPVAILAFDRPFRNTAEMDTALIEAWREAVADQETIVCLGDISAEGCMHVGHEQMWNAAPGYKRVVLGNHDVDLANHVGALEIEGRTTALVAPGNPDLVLTHVPLNQVPHGYVNVHGHVHEKPSPTRNRHINVSVEQLAYQPVRMTDVRRLARRLVERGDVPGETTAERIRIVNATMP